MPKVCRKSGNHLCACQEGRLLQEAHSRKPAWQNQGTRDWFGRHKIVYILRKVCYIFLKSFNYTYNRFHEFPLNT